MWTEYREIERDEVIPALRKAGVTSRSAWHTAAFGSTYEMVLVRPVEDFGVYDSATTCSVGHLALGKQSVYVNGFGVALSAATALPSLSDRT